MDWASARERLGAELIGAREVVVSRWRTQLWEAGEIPRCLDRLASELVLQAGAALADDAPAHTPWTRAGGVLCLDARNARGDERALAGELKSLWKAMAAHAMRVAFEPAEERAADAVLGEQLEAALRGASAELQALAFEEPIEDETLRFGGIKVLSWDARSASAPATRAA